LVDKDKWFLWRFITAKVLYASGLN